MNFGFGGGDRDRLFAPNYIKLIICPENQEETPQ